MLMPDSALRRLSVYTTIVQRSAGGKSHEHDAKFKLTMCSGNVHKYTGSLSRICMVSRAYFAM